MLYALLVTLLMSGLVLASCAPPGSDEPLIIGTTDSVTDLDPAESYDFHTWEIHHNTMDTLLVYTPGTTELEPGLAESYEVSADGLEYTFTLREGLEFPDGTAFNADAVVWSINRVMRLEGDPNWLVTSFVDSVEKVDEYTVKFVLGEAVGFFPLLIATQPYSPVSPDCYPENEFGTDSTCGGHGPYIITSWERDVEMVLEANPDYYGDAPAHSNVVVRYFADSTAMRLALEAGDIDVAWKTMTPSDYQDLDDDPNFVLETGPGAYIRYVCFNATTAPFDNPKVREALSLAIDRDEISDTVFQGTHQNLYSMVPMGMAGHIDAFGDRDLDQAIALLDQAGFDAANPLVMDFWWTPDHYGPTEGDVASVIKAAWEETGVVEVNLQSAEWAGGTPTTWIPTTTPGRSLSLVLRTTSASSTAGWRWMISSIELRPRRILRPERPCITRFRSSGPPRYPPSPSPRVRC
jgi:peptide/nickel transport system substrate-binding protein